MGSLCGKERLYLVLDLGVVDAEGVVSTAVAGAALGVEHLAHGTVAAGGHGGLVLLDGVEDLPSLGVIGLAEAALAVGDVAPAAAEGVENLGKLAVGQQTVKAARPELEDGLIALPGLEPGLVRVFWNESGGHEQLHAVLEARRGPCSVAANASSVSAGDGKAGLGLVLLRGFEEVRAHLKNLVVCHVQQAETAACDSRIKTKDKVRPGYVHGCSSVSSTMESSIWVDQTLIDTPHARRAEQAASGIAPPAKLCGHCCALLLAAWAHCRRFSTLCAAACASGEKCAPLDGPPATLTPYVCSSPPAGGPADRRRHGR